MELRILAVFEYGIVLRNYLSFNTGFSVGLDLLLDNIYLFIIYLIIDQRAEITKSSILRIILTHSVAKLNALLVTNIG